MGIFHYFYVLKLKKTKLNKRLMKKVIAFVKKRSKAEKLVFACLAYYSIGLFIASNL